MASSTQFGNYTELFHIFHSAKQHLKWPKISFSPSTDCKVQLFLATKGYIGIKVNGEYCGKITPEGYFNFYLQNLELQNAIKQFCLSPISSANVYGMEFGHCCFCGRELTAKESVTYGYGPICAENYGLPYEYKEEVEKKPAIASIAPINPDTDL